jgi:hypothetical protein
MKELNLETKYQIDQYLNSRVVQGLAFVGIVNIIALTGLYFSVVDSVAEKAAKEAIVRTEDRISSATDQLEKLSSKTVDSLASALQSAGAAKAEAKRINKEIYGLQELKVEKVSKVVNLINNSIEEIEILINANEALSVAETQLKSLPLKIENNKKHIKELLSKLSSIEIGIKDLINNEKLNNEFTKRFVTEINKNKILASLNEVHIEAGEASTPDISTNKQEQYIKFDKEFFFPPYVTASVFGNDKDYGGYPVIYDVSVTGFKIIVKDEYTGSGKAVYKYNTKFSYIALGKIKDK